MPLSFLFWLIYILWVIVWCWGFWPVTIAGPRSYGPVGGGLILAILIFILGWGTFGFVVK